MSESNQREGKVADKLLIVLFSLVLVVTGGWQFYQLVNGGLSDEQRLEDESLAAMKAKKSVQAAKRSLGWRTDGVIVEGGISYLVDDLQHGSRPGEYVNGEASAYGAIVDFRDQLAAKRIKLVVMIVDGKGVTNHLGTQELVTALEDGGVSVVHVCNEPVDQYLKHDSHWRPEMMERQAQRLGRVIESYAGIIREDDIHMESVCEVANEGDLVRGGLTGQTLETVNIRMVESMKNHPDTAKILLLGDSYANIFSDPEMGWGENAGLGERLSFYLQSLCKVVAVNGNGAHASRENLARNPDLLEGKQVVVWEFAARELDQDRWEKIAIPEAEGKVNQRKLANEKYDEYEVLSLPKWKMNSPYPNSLTEVLLKRKRDGEEVLVRMLLKKDRRFTKVEKLKKGEVILLKISDFKKQKQHQRSELFSLDRYDLDVYWGELK